MRVGVLGINHKLADVNLRELFASRCQQRLKSGCSLHGEHHFVLLSTCNRTEIYFFSDNLTETHSYLLRMLRQDLSEDFDQKLYSFFGQDCLMHLCRVATGLDSAIIVETEIQGQVKIAYENAKQCAQLPFELHYLFQKALAISKKVRNVLPSQAGLPDIEHAILQAGKIFFNNYIPSILFVGASGINDKIISYFKRKQLLRITLCNRSEFSGISMAEKYQIPYLEWKNLESWPQFDWVILGTKAPSPLLQSKHVNQPILRKLIIDLSVPRNAEPGLANKPQLTLLNIDQINNQLQTRTHSLVHKLTQAEKMIADASKQHVTLFSSKEKVRFG